MNLKPCPFCGSELMFCPSHIEGQYFVNKPGGVCQKCRMEFIGIGYRVYGEVQSEDFSDEKFFERWNTRPSEDVLKAENEQLKEVIKQLKEKINDYINDVYVELLHTIVTCIRTLEEMDKSSK